MAFARAQIQSLNLVINTAGATIGEFYFPRGARIIRYFDTPAVAQAAHATIVVDATFVNAGTDGSGSATLAVLTNDTDLADSTTRKSSAWVAHDAKEINTESRPGTPTAAQNVRDVIAAGGVVKCTLTGAGVTPAAGNHTVGIEYVEST